MLAIGLRRALALGAAAASLTCFLLPPIADARQRYTRERERPQPTAEPAIRKPDGPVNIIISLGSQRLWLYDKHGLVTTSIVSCSSFVGLNSTTSVPAKSFGVWPGGA